MEPVAGLGDCVRITGRSALKYIVLQSLRVSKTQVLAVCQWCYNLSKSLWWGAAADLLFVLPQAILSGQGEGTCTCSMHQFFVVTAAAVSISRKPI